VTYCKESDKCGRLSRQQHAEAFTEDSGEHARLVRPPDILVSGLIFYQAFFLSFFFSSSNLRARQTELNHIRPRGRK